MGNLRSKTVSPYLFVPCIIVFGSYFNQDQNRVLANPAQNTPDWLKKVNVFSMGPRPIEILQECNASVVAWGNSAVTEEDKPWMENEVNLVHSLGLKYVAALGPITTSGVVFNQRPELLEAICLNINGDKIQLEWYPISPSEPFYWGCTNNPTWQDYLKEVIHRAIDAGADGIHIDEIYGTEHAIWRSRGCFCITCMDGFRAFMRSRYSNEELLIRFGIANVDSFNYRQYLIDNHAVDIWKGERPWEAPLFNEYHSYQNEAVQRVMKALISQTRQYALDTYSREISFSANINDLNPSGLKFTDELDIFILEFYKGIGYPPVGKATSVLKLAHSLDNKSGILMTAINTNADLLKRAKTSNLMKIYIAEAYAALGSFMIPYNIYALDEEIGTSPGSFSADITSISPYYKFIMNHSTFYENLKSIAKVGVIFPYSISAWPNSFHGTCYALSDLNIQYDGIFAGDNHYLQRPLNIEVLSRYEVLILSRSESILETDFNTLLTYLDQGGKIIGWGRLEIIDEDGNQIINATLESFKSPGYHSYGQGVFYYLHADMGLDYLTNRTFDTISVFANALDSLLTNRVIRTPYSTSTNVFAYMNPKNEDIFLHCINYDYDIDTDEINQRDSIEISINVLDATKYTSAFVASPDFPSLIKLPIETTENSINLTIPTLNIYDVVYLSKRSSPGPVSIVETSPQSNTSIISGEALEFSIDIDNQSGFPLFYNWFINGQLDLSSFDNTLVFIKQHSYEGIDTIKVQVTNGFRELEHSWTVESRKYIFPKILFDESHNERNTISYERAQELNPDHPDWCYFGILKSKMDLDYLTDRYTTGSLTAEILEDYDALILAAPDDNLSYSEIINIIYFVSNGGGLIFLGDAGLNQNINILLGRFGINFDNTVIFESAPPGHDGGNPLIVDFENHPSLLQHSRLQMNWGGSLTTSLPAVSLGFSDSTTWRDANWNRQKDENEVFGPFTTVAAAEYENGRIFCVSDNSFHDDYLQWRPVQDALFLSALEWITENVNKVPHLLGDLNGDGTVDFIDFAHQAGNWLRADNELVGDLDRNGLVDIFDIVLLTQAWLEQID